MKRGRRIWRRELCCGIRWLEYVAVAAFVGGSVVDSGFVWSYVVLVMTGLNIAGIVLKFVFVLIILLLVFCLVSVTTYSEGDRQAN
jgi:hypothetical protein